MPVSTSTSLTPYLPNFLLSRFKRNSTCYIHRLPLDIHVDQIFIYLRVEDVLCLRRVSKAFFLLTHEPIIWKRFLSHLSIPIPPLRPTFKYALQASDFEIEQLVSRAISIEDNWRQKLPKVISSRSVPTQYKVMDLKLLPGGKYLLASVKDEYRFFIIVYCLDHPKGPHALARVPTHGRASHLEAKYVKFRGKQVIMIAYIRRTFQTGGPENQDASEYSTRTELDPPHPFQHELVCLEISLDSLEALANPNINPGGKNYTAVAQRQKGPFFEVITLPSESEMDIISLFDHFGMPILSVVQQPDRIIILDLEYGTKLTLEVQEHDDYVGMPHRIKAIRNLPYQDHILVIRSVKTEDEESDSVLNVLEIYKLPSKLGEIEPGYRLSERELFMGWVEAAHISDYGIPITNDDTYRLRRDYQPPPPISVYLEIYRPNGLKHFIIWPSLTETSATTTHGPRKRYHYDLAWVCQQTTHHCDPLLARVLPGAYRTLVYSVSDTDRKAAPALVRLRRYLNPEFQQEAYDIPRVPRTSHVMRRNHPPIPTNTFGNLDLGSKWKEHYYTRGVQAITWDEGIGRVCMSGGNGQDIEIFDFSSAVQPDKRFEAWKRTQEFVMHDTYDNSTGMPMDTD